MKYDGQGLYELAIEMTDLTGQRFCDMLAKDSKKSIFERDYFTSELEDYERLGLDELVGFGLFCLEMEKSGQGEWTEKIKILDEQLVIRVLERRMLEAQDGKVDELGNKRVDKETMDSCVRALSGLVSRARLTPDGKGENQGDIIIQIVGVKPEKETSNGEDSRK